MEHLRETVPMPTEIIRTPASGPKPANTLAFIQCRASGADIRINRTDLVRWEIEFKSQFQIDGYLQAKHDWYLANTHVSATGMIRLVSSTTDLAFVVALDSVDPFIDLDGVLGFNCQFGLQIDAFGLGNEDGVDLACNICAYVLLYEPQTEFPPSGQSPKQTWLFDPRNLDREFGLVPPKPGGGKSSVSPISRLRLTQPSHQQEKGTHNCD